MTLSSNTTAARLEAMNVEIERLYKEGRDFEAHNLEARADALARRMFREDAS